MSKTYNVTFTVVAPEGWDEQFDPYYFDEPFEDLGAEIFNVAIEKAPEEEV
jgi:hypothetical protein